MTWLTSIFGLYAMYLGAVVAALITLWSGDQVKSVHDEGFGYTARVVSLATSIMILALSVSFAVGIDMEADLGGLIWAALIGGSATYVIGAASWTGAVPFACRAVGWLLMSLGVLIPSTLSIGIPLVAALAFTLAPISEVAQTGTQGARPVSS